MFYIDGRTFNTDLRLQTSTRAKDPESKETCLQDLPELAPSTGTGPEGGSGCSGRSLGPDGPRPPTQCRGTDSGPAPVGASVRVCPGPSSASGFNVPPVVSSPGPRLPTMVPTLLACPRLGDGGAQSAGSGRPPDSSVREGRGKDTHLHFESEEPGEHRRRGQLLRVGPLYRSGPLDSQRTQCTSSTNFWGGKSYDTTPRPPPVLCLLGPVEGDHDAPGKATVITLTLSATYRRRSRGNSTEARRPCRPPPSEGGGWTPS